MEWINKWCYYYNVKYYLATKANKLQLYATISKGKDMNYSQRHPPACCLEKAITDFSYLPSTRLNLLFWIRNALEPRR